MAQLLGVFFFISCVHCFKVQEASCSASYGKNKTYKSKQTHKKPTNKVHRLAWKIGKTIASALQISNNIGKSSERNQAPAARKNIKQSNTSPNSQKTYKRNQLNSDEGGEKPGRGLWRSWGRAPSQGGNPSWSRRGIDLERGGDLCCPIGGCRPVAIGSVSGTGVYD